MTEPPLGGTDHFLEFFLLFLTGFSSFPSVVVTDVLAVVGIDSF